ncbi:restriction endonuclease subunit S [Polynucleobacter sp. JS-Safj-400b-B2]|uniref:restriction endonuclease subunit S n=1 Tax=Polynucleobacter sp. JS-Safj-400b-B2 TaxID=2576921 RepID=UPI001C0B0555|nr:restriction endonuclease subunit S [Polynucleobacter sp. JS-Safj-400b-B2]MBU3626470.1 restriction endonuclease subunit S [Polynucleobacter sp. JS-Safj-400b-B2]
MNHFQRLLVENIDLWSAADAEKLSKRGRSSTEAIHLYGISKLRAVILGLAANGSLVRGGNGDDALKLLKKIQDAREKLFSVALTKKFKPTKAISDTDTPFPLPKNWIWVRLGEISNFGSTEKRNSIDDDTWVLDLEDIEKDTSKLLRKVRYAERRSLSDKNAFQAGDVLYGKLRPYLNKVLVADEGGVCTTEILPIRCYGPFVPEYFKYVLMSPYFLRYTTKISYGMKMPRLGTEDGRDALFPLPPLDEQRQIADKVGELLLLCDGLENKSISVSLAHEALVKNFLEILLDSRGSKEFEGNWNNISNIFDVLFTSESSINLLKSSILQLGMQGRLTQQNPSDGSAQDLLKLIDYERTNSSFSGGQAKRRKISPLVIDHLPQIPENWVWTQNERISHEWGQKTPLESFLYIDVSSIDSEHGVVSSPEIVSPKNAPSRARKIVRPGSVIYSTIRPYLLNVAVIDEQFDIEPIASTAFVVIHPWASISSRFIYYYLRSPTFIDYVESVQAGIAYPAINDAQFYSAPFPLPPLSEQHRIVTVLEKLLRLCDEMKVRINHASALQRKVADALVDKALT